MIKIWSLGSSSTGNCFYIYDGYSYLILDAGFDKMEVQSGLAEIGGTFNKVSGIILTHEHKDHSRGIQAFKSVNKYMTKGTFEGCVKKNIKIDETKLHFIKKLKTFNTDGYRIMPFRAFHDTEDPVSFLIENKSGEKIVYITDTSQQPNLVKNAEVYIIESNHSEDMLRNNLMNKNSPKSSIALGQRILDTHLNTQQTIDYLKKCIGKDTKQIILMHLSPKNNQPNVLRRVVSNELKFKNVDYIHPTKHQLLKLNWEVGYQPRRIKS